MFQDIIPWLLIASCVLGIIILIVILKNKESSDTKKNFRALLSALENTSSKNDENLSRQRQEINSMFFEFSRQVSDSVNKNSENNYQIIDRLCSAVDKRLTDIKSTVDEKLTANLKTGLDDSFAKVSSQLSSLYQSMGEVKTLTADVCDLKSILSNVKNRGTWGEIQLEKLLSDFLAPSQYVKNAKVNSDFVEFAVLLPGEENKVLLPIDSKFPMDRYEKTLNASGDTLAAANKELEKAITEEAKKISTKYITPPKTTDFAIMFLPSEGLFAKAIELSLLQSLQQKYKVMLAGPSTLCALLNSLQTGFKTLALQEHSSRIMGLLSSVRQEFDRFEDYIEKTKNSLRTAQGHLDFVSKKSTKIQTELSGIEYFEDN